MIEAQLKAMGQCPACLGTDRACHVPKILAVIRRLQGEQP